MTSLCKDNEKSLFNANKKSLQACKGFFFFFNRFSFYCLNYGYRVDGNIATEFPSWDDVWAEELTNYRN